MESSLPQCPIHFDLKQVFFCVECEELLCRRCMMDNHRLHDYDETEVVLDKRYALVHEIIEPAKKVLADGKEAKDFTDPRNKLSAHHNELKMAIKHQIEKIHKYVSDREMHLLSCLENMVESEYVAIECAESEYAELLLKLEGNVACAQKLTEDSKTTSMLTEAKRLSLAIEKDIETLSKLTSPVQERVKCIEIIFEEDDNAILKHAIDKMGVLLESNDMLHSESGGTSKRYSLPRNVSLPSMPFIDERNPKLDSQVSILQPTAVISCTEKGKNFYPCGIGVGSNNLITVSDLHNNFVKVLTNTGKIIDSIETNKGCPFKGPCALHVDVNNDIYILERDSNSIRKYANGSLLDLGKFNKQFSDPRGILVLKEKVYVTDWKNSCVHLLILTNNKLTYQSSIGRDFLKQPAGIAFSNCDGKIVVSDQENHCVWILSKEGDLVNVVGGERGDCLGMLNSPYGVAVTNDGKVVIAEKGNARISLFSIQGSYLYTFGCKGSSPGEFNQLRHVCTNLNNQVLVADEMNQRIQIFDISQ